ncbi:MAG: sensor histidine kinase [Deltaproteobacteria bacterium]|nr:sensor histidine kinase [Deltaproteobacteria bacterium]
MALINKLPELPFFQIFRGRRRGRLVRHYFILSVILMGGGLIASGLIEIYFRYHESWQHIDRLHQEVAAGTAFKIERFVQEIEGTMRAATKNREIIVKGLTPEYKFELEKLLTIARPITEVAALDAHGFAQLRVSRLHAVFPVEQRDRSGSVAFQQAMEGKSYFGPVYFVRSSEPYMTVAVPIERFAGEVVGVLQAEVNLKYIWDVVSGIKVGEAGYAYAVTRSGDLIAHQDIGLVLQQRNIAHLEQVKRAFRPTSGAARQTAIVTHNLQEEKVFSSYALIPALDWAVFAELPTREAYGPLYASLFRTSTLLLVGLAMALFASAFVARRVVRPLRKLREGVGQIGSGDLSFRVDLKTGDELEALGEEFNKMTASLQDAQAGLERKVAERTRELIVANQKLDEASRHKSQFLASVSHELRTPLNAIIGFTRLVLRKTAGQIPDLQSENLQKVLISAEHLLQLINGLLDLSKIEAGRMEVLPESFRLDEIIEKAASTVEPMLKDGSVRLVSEIALDLPPINTDREKFEQILLNLLSNAAKFTERGEIKISAWQENGFLKVAVSDTGIGMEREALQYIFEEFRRVDMAGTRKYSGTGLGLAIVKRLVTLLGGELSVESEMGKGSTFTVKLPIHLSAG